MKRISEDVRRQVLEGSLIRAMLIIAVPVVVNSMIQTCYNLTDTFWLGRVGTDALAAINLVTPVQNIVINFGSGISVAGSVLISQLLGAGKKDEANRMASQVFTCALLFACVCAGLICLLTPALVRWLGAEGGVLDAGISYLRLVILDMPFLFTVNVFQAVSQSRGNTVRPMLVNLLGVLINMALDPLLMVTLDLGAAGAALATVGAKAAAACVALAALVSRKGELRLKREELRPDREHLRQIVHIGLPTALGSSMMQFGFLLMSRTVLAYGSRAMAAYGIGNKINGLISMPSNAMGSATATITALNTGAGKPDRAQKGCRLSILCSVTFLFAGDCYDYNLEAVAKKYPGYLDCDVFQNPHHNGSHSNYVLDLVSPKAVVFSTDNTSLPRNNYLARIREHKSIYFITGSYNDGNVLITSDGEHLEAYCGYPLSSVKLNPVDAMVPGQKVRMTGSLEPSRRANPKLLNWKSSNPEVVKVSKGTLTAVAEGTATITATAINGVSDSVEVQVSNTGVILNKHEISLKVGEAGQLKYKLTGAAVAGGIEWYSDDSEIAMVTGDGEVIGTGVGETRIFARIGSGAQAACVVTVTEKPVKYVELNKSKIRLKVGETYALQCKVRPNDATDKRLEWASSDESVATVDAFGNVTAVGKGSAKIGVRASNGVYDLCRVKVE